jgi:hypothetical protein
MATAPASEAGLFGLTSNRNDSISLACLAPWARRSRAPLSRAQEPEAGPSRRQRSERHPNPDLTSAPRDRAIHRAVQTGVSGWNASGFYYWRSGVFFSPYYSTRGSNTILAAGKTSILPADQRQELCLCSSQTLLRPHQNRRGIPEMLVETWASRTFIHLSYA